nr:hypothetical protein [Tanacetum cinerariifolium]
MIYDLTYISLPEDIYTAVDSCETAQEIWLRVQQMMKGSDIGIQEKKAKLFNEWERQIAQPGMNMGQDRQMQMVGGNGGNQFRKYAGNLAGYNDVIGSQTQLLIAQKEEVGIQLQAKEYDLMTATADVDHIEEVNSNCILMANLQQASTSGTQTDIAPVYDTNGSAKVHENCDDNEIFNMFTQEEQYTELLEPIPESHQVPHNNNDVISEDTHVEHGGETVEQHPVNFEETRALYESLYQNLAIKVEKVNSVNRKLKETNAEMTIELARYKNQERINPDMTSREAKKVPNTVRASNRTKPITVSQPPVITKKDVNYDLNGFSSTGIDNPKTRRPQPRSNTKNDRVPSAFKSSQSKNKEAKVEEHHRNLLLSKNKKHMLSTCNNFMLDSQNVYSKVVYAMCKQSLISVNHDECLLNYVNDKNSRGKKQSANVSIKEKQKKREPKGKKPKKVESYKSLATPMAKKPRSSLRWSPTGRMFDINDTIIASSKSESQSDCSKGDNACTSNPVEPTIKRFPNATFSLA